MWGCWKRAAKKGPLCSDTPESLLYIHPRSGAWLMQMNNLGFSWGLPYLAAIRRSKYAKQCITLNICEILWNFAGFELLCLHSKLGGHCVLGFIRILFSACPPSFH